MLVRARVRGTRSSCTLTALVDTGARMSVLDSELSFISISGHRLRASEAVVPEFEVDGELLRYEAVAVADLPDAVKAALRSSGLDERLIVGLLTLERANMVPDATRGLLRRVEAFIF